MLEQGSGLACLSMVLYAAKCELGVGRGFLRNTFEFIHACSDDLPFVQLKHVYSVQDLLPFGCLTWKNRYTAATEPLHRMDSSL